MNIDLLIRNFSNPPVLFFFLGVAAARLKSDLEIPAALAKFFSLYLLFDIGIKGGEELFHSGITIETLYVIVSCVSMSLLIAALAFFILRLKLNIYDAGAISATYGSVSAVTFASSIAFLENLHVSFSGYMVVGMAMMESPAIVMGIILIRTYLPPSEIQNKVGKSKREVHINSFRHILSDAFLNGSVFLLLGSLVIGYLAGADGEKDLHFFVTDLYKGMLCFYLLDMGLTAGSRMDSLKEAGMFLISFGIFFPLLTAGLGILVAYVLQLSTGNALLFTILCASASYIAVPAAMRIAVPQANMGLLLPMALGITFPFNIFLGIPLYYSVITAIW